MYQIYFIWSNTLHVSDGLSVHPVSSICLTYACCSMYSLELLMMDGKTARNMYSVIPNKINLRH